MDQSTSTLANTTMMLFTFLFKNIILFLFKFYSLEYNHIQKTADNAEIYVHLYWFFNVHIHNNVEYYERMLYL